MGRAAIESRSIQYSCSCSGWIFGRRCQNVNTSGPPSAFRSASVRALGFCTSSNHSCSSRATRGNRPSNTILDSCASIFIPTVWALRLPAGSICLMKLVGRSIRISNRAFDGRGTTRSLVRPLNQLSDAKLGYDKPAHRTQSTGGIDLVLRQSAPSYKWHRYVLMQRRTKDSSHFNRVHNATYLPLTHRGIASYDIEPITAHCSETLRTQCLCKFLCVLLSLGIA